LRQQNIKYLTNDYLVNSNAVIPDYFDLGKQGAEFLYNRGVRKMGMFGLKNIYERPLRWDQDGFMSVVQSHADIQVRPEWISPVLPTIGDGYDAFEKLWTMPNRPEGLVVTDEVMFLGVAMAMNKRGVSFPRDLQVIVNGTEGALETGGINPPRLCFSPRRSASLLVDQILTMIRDDVMDVPMVRVGAIVVPECVSAKSTGMDRVSAQAPCAVGAES